MARSRVVKIVASVSHASRLVPAPAKAASRRTRRRAVKAVSRAREASAVSVLAVPVGAVVADAVVAAEVATATESEYSRRHAPRTGAPSYHVTEWTDRALGEYAGSAVGRFRGLDSLGIDS